MSDSFEQFASNLLSEYDYIFYISPEGIAIEDNGVRETDANYRMMIDDSILNILSSFGHRCKKVRELKGTTNERIEQMLGFIQG